MKEPLLPAFTMRTMLLFQLTLLCAALPASSRALFRMPLTLGGLGGGLVGVRGSQCEAQGQSQHASSCQPVVCLHTTEG